MSDAKREPATEPDVIGGYVAGMDFSNLPHGTIEIQPDAPFRSALGKKARVLLVPDDPAYRAAPDLADALAWALTYGSFDCAVDNPMHAAELDKARLALRKAGRLP